MRRIQNEDTADAVVDHGGPGRRRAVSAALGADAPGAEESRTVLSPQALQEIAQVEAEIDRIEIQTLERLAAPPDNHVQQIELLGKLMLYDKQLSAARHSERAGLV